MRVNSIKELAVVLQNQRLSLDFSQSQLADLACTRQATVSNFENNPAQAKIETLFKLLSVLDLELEIRPKGQLAHDNKLDW
ncbi:helix-turn-helix domain-containing protein [Thiomicrospira cyclica]|uniref:Helix-turn-helix domain protein n=1 Tax=Thiomicrospira cyclica (strain DSM 14477 / JCM 11371 / ALM1) TaxID=717773 RepID=F6DAV0_THICA|nr:helix-turn-helix domain-containing protein [Thiomicrospira cyclica]AEG31193.1 helix-turn-helix domain protein [Thiomicrospira cyclica ALM1]